MASEAHATPPPSDSRAAPPLISRDTIKTIAQSVGIAHLKDDVADALAPDVEFRLRDVIAQALKFMAHGRRERLTADDVNFALRLRHAEPLYGFSAADPPRFCRAGGHADVYFLDDPEINLSDVMSEPLPPAPREPSFSTHWLAVNGVQPSVPENPALERGGGKRARGGEAAEVEVVALARHALTEEEQLWLERITSAVRDGAPSSSRGDGETQDAQRFIKKPRTVSPFDIALRAVAKDSSTHALSPHLSYFVASEVNSNLRCLPRLVSAMRLLHAMLQSLTVDLEPYLAQIMPAVLTCIVGKQLCALPHEDHWALRRTAAGLVCIVVSRFGERYPTLQERLTKTLLAVLRDPTKPLTSHYGAIVCLQMLGPMAVHTLLMPSMATYVHSLEEQLHSALALSDPPAAAADRGNAQARSERKRKQQEKLEAILRLHGLALHVCCTYFFVHGAMFNTGAPLPPLSSKPPAVSSSSLAPGGVPLARGGGKKAAAARAIGAASGATGAKEPPSATEQLSAPAVASAGLLLRPATSYQTLEECFGPEPLMSFTRTTLWKPTEVVERPVNSTLPQALSQRQLSRAYSLLDAFI